MVKVLRKTYVILSERGIYGAYHPIPIKMFRKAKKVNQEIKEEKNT